MQKPNGGKETKMHSNIYVLTLLGTNNKLNENVDLEHTTELDLPLDYMEQTMCDYVREYYYSEGNWMNQLQWLTSVCPVLKLSSVNGVQQITIDIEELKQFNVEQIDKIRDYLNENVYSYKKGRYNIEECIFHISELIEDKHGFYIIDKNHDMYPQTINEFLRRTAENYYNEKSVTFAVTGLFDYHS